jgi:hypothetical protein
LADYQTVSYILTSKRGNQAQFQNMITTCHAAGVKVIAGEQVGAPLWPSAHSLTGAWYRRHLEPHDTWERYAIICKVAGLTFSCSAHLRHWDCRQLCVHHHFVGVLPHSYVAAYAHYVYPGIYEAQVRSSRSRTGTLSNASTGLPLLRARTGQQYRELEQRGRGLDLPAGWLGRVSPLAHPGSCN